MQPSGVAKGGVEASLARNPSRELRTVEKLGASPPIQQTSQLMTQKAGPQGRQLLQNMRQHEEPSVAVPGKDWGVLGADDAALGEDVAAQRAVIVALRADRTALGANLTHEAEEVAQRADKATMQ